MNDRNYQILPPLLEDEYESLKASIAQNGVEVPVIVDEDGQTVDGFHRVKACGALKIFCPREVRIFASEAEKYELVVRLNCRRRQLNRQQKRDLISAYLRCDPRIADNHLADLIGGISQNTVADVRRELESTFQLEKLERHRGRDGKERPTKYKRIVANSAKQAEVALTAIRCLPESCCGKIIDPTTAARRARREQTKQDRRKRLEQIVAATPQDNIAIEHCDFRDLKVDSESIDLVLTDVLWNESSFDDWLALGRKAVEWLKPDGLLATFIGQRFLFSMTNAVAQGGLVPQWCFAGLFAPHGNAAEVNGVMSRWRPVVVFSKAKQHTFRKTIDAFEVGMAEKEWSVLQQTVQGTRWLLEHLSDPGDFVLDACMGTGTTAVSVLTATDGPRRFLGCDRDETMVRIARHRAATYRVESGHSSHEGIVEASNDVAQVCQN